jgi:hypothetical protein
MAILQVGNVVSANPTVKRTATAKARFPPLTSERLRQSEILPGSVADFGHSVWGGLQIDA